MAKAQEVEKVKLLPVAFDTTIAAAKELVKKYDGLIITDTKTEKSTREACAELRKIRTGMPTTIKTWWAPYKKRYDEVKADGAKILAITKPVEEKLKATIDGWETLKEEKRKEKARLQKEREDYILAAINHIAALDAGLGSETSEVISGSLGVFQALVIDDTYAEYQGAAGQAKGSLIARTEALLEKVQVQEKADAERVAENERLAKQKVIQDAEAADLAEKKEALDKQTAELEKLKKEAVLKTEPAEKKEPAKPTVTTHSITSPVEILITREYVIELTADDCKDKSEKDMVEFGLKIFEGLGSADITELFIRSTTAEIHEPEGE